MEFVRDLHWSEFGKVDLNFSGVTYTRNRISPYAVWHGGQIWFYTDNEKDARIAHVEAKSNRQGVPSRD
jgi:alpha-N-acetylglucosamine transferase